MNSDSIHESTGDYVLPGHVTLFLAPLDNLHIHWYPIGGRGGNSKPPTPTALTCLKSATGIAGLCPGLLLISMLLRGATPMDRPA